MKCTRFHKRFLIVLVLMTEFAKAQNYITNPGFEGNDGIDVIPENWSAGCGVMNTPDTQPGWWNIENKPYEGKSFINLLFKEDGTTESVYQQLATPLDSGGCYLIEIHLAQACQDSLSNLDPYDLNHPGDLQIRGSETYGCGTGQMLVTFNQVANCKWKTYYAVFQAQQTINYIYLEFSKGTSPFNNGSVLIDGFLLENLHPLPDQQTDVAFGDIIQLNASVAGNGYTWSMGDSLINTDSTQITLQIEQNVTIDLSYFSADGCLVTERFVILVKPQIPNIFTPLDGDNVNDVFYIRGLVEPAQLQVFNRWGGVVFQQMPYQNNWSPSGLSSGVYFYRLDLPETGRFFEGFVTIL